MAEHADREPRRLLPRSRTFGTATVTARNRFAWLWSRESVLRLILSVLLALALWLYVTDKQQPGTIDFPQGVAISAINYSRNLTVTNVLGTVHVRYRTDTPSLYVSASSFQPTVNLQSRKAGSFRVPVDVSAAPGIKVVSISPRKVPVVIEPIVSKNVPVVPNFLASNPPSGYFAKPPSISPDIVQVQGPQSVVSQIVRVSVDINLSEARSSTDTFSKPIPENSQGQAVTSTTSLTLKPAEVQVRVTVQAVTGFKTLPIVVPVSGFPRSGFGVTSISPNPSAIIATGPPGILSKLTRITTAPVNVRHRKAGEFTQRLRLLLPNGVSADQTQKVFVTIQIHAVEASSSTQIAVNPVNVAPGLVAHMRPAGVLVTLIGPSNLLRKAAHRVTATVDLTNLGSGFYQLRPSVKAAPGFNIGAVYPQTVNVSIQPATAG
ncbi:MAG: CdaR family protein [Chloroflexota bacterium]